MGFQSVDEGGLLHRPLAKIVFQDYLPWFIIIIIVFFAILAYIGFWFGRKVWRRGRTSRILEHLGATSYPPSSGQEFNSSCPICISDFIQDEEVTLLPCGHIYKPGCLRKQLQAGYVQCEMCRAHLQ